MANFKDITGRRFGQLVVVNRCPDQLSYWLCLCDCGNIHKVKTANLTGGYVKSCGCLKQDAADLRCQNSSYIEMLRENGRKSAPQLIVLNKSRALPPGMAGKVTLLSQYKYEARVRDLCWELTDEEFYHLVASNCIYCGNQPKQKLIQFVYTGIDRKDNTLGYTKDNCVPSCGLCNWWKRDLTFEKFVTHVQQIAQHQRNLLTAKVGA